MVRYCSFAYWLSQHCQLETSLRPDLPTSLLQTSFGSSWCVAIRRVMGVMLPTEPGTCVLLAVGGLPEALSAGSVAAVACDCSRERTCVHRGPVLWGSSSVLLRGALVSGESCLIKQAALSLVPPPDEHKRVYSCVPLWFLPRQVLLVAITQFYLIVLFWQQTAAPRTTQQQHRIDTQAVLCLQGLPWQCFLLITS